ncbi:hypothetical protein ADK76_07970 [Streptomyces griseoflavus]|uniref:hypothetical protein n=1 Tax=Streptomyces rimosus TaxID=1927 RepID=UPI0004C94608|nr:hypothetical protein [Streptomyces rimosus]KOG64989.1 hypothetical protein ADK76_07970 [Streptomyces griseoflavus]
MSRGAGAAARTRRPAPRRRPPRRSGTTESSRQRACAAWQRSSRWGRDGRTVGETGRARALNEEALRSLTATLGEDHPWTLGVAYNLCADHEHGLDPGGAPDLSRTTAERATRTLGARHPWALLAWAAHAAVLRLTGAADEAGTVEARALAGLTETLGGGHRLTVAAGTGRRPVWTFDPLPG